MALAAPSVLATSAGETIVDLGGTAADATIAMALVAMCTEPGVCAPGSGGYIAIDPGDGAPVVVDGYVAIPGIGFDGEVSSKTISMAYGGGVTTEVGPGSIAVPGSFASFGIVSQRYGKVPWSEILNLVADVVEPGFPLSQTSGTYLVDSGDLIFADDPATYAALSDGVRFKKAGEMVWFANLASTLRQIGQEGPMSFYRGDLAEKIVADLSSRGSAITSEDLAQYRPIVRQPLQDEIAGWKLNSNPAPAVGGMAILGVLHAVASSPTPLDPKVWSEALLNVLSLRQRFELEDDRDAAAAWMMRSLGLRSGSTITVSAADGKGAAVAATFSAGYGSGVIPADTGLMMNNCLGEIELMPGGVEALIPGERMLSNMAPTTLRSGRDVVAIGSPGADRITSALAITLIRFLLGGDKLPDAIEHPRLHPESLDPIGIAAEVGLSLPHDSPRWYREPHMFFGGVNSAGLIDGELIAHADSRRVGSAVIV